MKNAITFLFFFSILPVVTRAQVICIYCYNQNDSISSGVNNLLLNGGFENSTCAVGGRFCPNASNYNCNLNNWTCTGGGTSTYANVLGTTGISRIVEGSRGVYLGNYYCKPCSAITNDTSCLNDSLCRVTQIPAGYPLNTAVYGGTTGVSLQQTVNGLAPGNIYVLEFWAGGEGNSYVNPGLFALDVGFGNIFLRCRTTPRPAGIGTRFIVVFRAAQIAHTIKFTNWGHICSNCTEVALDDVRLYTLPELSAAIPLCPNCAGIEQAPDFDLGNDTAYCHSFSRTLIAGDSTTVWSTGATGSQITVNTAGTYWASVAGTCGPMRDSIVLSIDTALAHVNIGNDTSYCGNFVRTLITGQSNTLWNTGSTLSQLTINMPGTYWAGVTNGCGMARDTIQIASGNAIFNIGNDTLFCVNINRTLSTGIANTIWSTGDTASQITINTGGIYWARVDSACGASIDSVNIIQGYPPASFTLGNDTTYCAAFSRSLSTGIANTLWSNGVTAPQITVTGAGTYWARVINECGSRADTIAISQTSPPPSFSLGSDVTYCSNFSRYLSTGNASTLWSTGVTSSYIYATTPGTYWARASNSCGTVTDTVVITQLSAPAAFFLGSDVVYCSSSFTRVLSTGVATTVWSTGAVGPLIVVNTPGTYWATVSNYCGTRTDSITLSVETPPASFSLGNDTSYCGNFSHTLSTGVATTFWSSGAAAPQITVTSPGTYWAMVSGACGVATDTIVLSTENAVFNLGSDTLYCSNFSRILSTGVSNTYWNTGATGPQITVDSTGTYWARIDSACGASSDTIVITRQSLPASFNLGNDTTYCANFSRTLITGVANTVWSTGVTSPQITVTSAGTYRANVTNVCGTTRDTIVISRLYAPAFSLGSDVSYCSAFSRYLSTGYTPSLWSTGATTSYIYATTPGTYWALATNVCGTATDTVVISLLTLPSINLGADTTYCGNFIRTLSTGIASTLWSTGITSSQIIISSPGVYWARATNTCGTVRDTISLLQGVQPIINLGNDTSFCNGQSLTIDAFNPNSSYHWQNNTVNSTLTVTGSGVYSVTVTSQGGCSATDNIAVNVMNAVSLSTSFVNTSCGNSDGSVSVIPTSGTAPFNYLWNNGDTMSFITNLSAGTYIVTTTDANRCSATVSVVVNSSSNSSVTISSDKSFMCSGDSAQICAPLGFSSYLWNTGQTTPCIYIKLAGNYYVTATDANHCTAVSNHLAVNVYPLPPVSISVNGDTLTAYNAVTYQWYLNGNPINNATSNIYIATQGGGYSVAVTDTNGCLAISSQVIISGIVDVTEEDVMFVYPNPASSELNISLNGMQAERVRIFNANGQLISDTKQPRSNRIDIRDLSTGVYIAEIKVRDAVQRVRWVKM